MTIEHVSFEKVPYINCREEIKVILLKEKLNDLIDSFNSLEKQLEPKAENTAPGFAWVCPGMQPEPKECYLLDCPFCACKSFDVRHDKKDNHYIECLCCGARSKNFESDKEAILAWNTRSKS